MTNQASLFIGRKGSGKTSLCQSIVKQAVLEDKPHPIILDPHRDPAWYSPLVFREPKEFRKKVKKHGGFSDQYTEPRRLVIVDEAPEYVSHFDEEMRKIATHQRHWGIIPCIISQRFTEINKTARQQVDRIFLFACFPDDAIQLSKLWVSPELRRAPKLKQFEFLDTTHYGPVWKRRLTMK